MASPTLTTSTQYVTAANGVRFAYRHLGPSFTSSTGQIPLVLHIHFRGNMDFWDPELLDPLARERPVLIFDQAGVGRSSGAVATTIQGWADNVLAFLEALNLTKIDLLGFSMGGLTVQQVALIKPDLVRRLILAGTGASLPGPNEQGKDIVWPREQAPERPFTLLRTADAQNNNEVEDALAVSFFPDSNAGREACKAYRQRVAKRSVAGEPPILDFLGREGTKRQSQAVVDWNTYNPRNSWDRLGELKMPVLVVNGDNDLLIPTSRSWEMFRRIRNAGIIIYPAAGHGFLWQYAPQFAQDINNFLGNEWPKKSRSSL